jgi:nucleoid DNA-binding protein
MNKNDLVITLTKVLSTKREAQNAVDRIFDEISRALEKGDRVVISNFGSFQTVIMRAKKGRNPKTGEAIQLPPRKKIRFHQSKEFFKR